MARYVSAIRKVWSGKALDVNEAARLASESKHDLFAWNTRIFFISYIDNKLELFCTSLTIEDFEF